MSDFPGFPAETRAFLLDLRENNTREWFAANKSRYEEVVKAPAVAWVAALGRALANAGRGLGRRPARQRQRLVDAGGAGHALQQR